MHRRSLRLSSASARPTVCFTRRCARLSNKLVQMLLYCYINLCLINQVSEDLSDFLTSAIANVGEE